MTQMPTTLPGDRFSTTPRSGAPGTSGWVGWIGFAAVMLGWLAFVHVFEGIVALVSPSYYESRGSQLVVHLDMTGWGWLQILVGVLLLLTAVGVLGGWLWARILATLVAMGSALVQLAFLAAQPVWSIITITVCVVVILALTVHGDEIRAGRS